ncbi:hypothetical protein Slin14017_G034350 [Septoria linicola]|nr:hypothetical protein Slin14017_G034350 [Septoria linicola]
MSDAYSPSTQQDSSSDPLSNQSPTTSLLDLADDPQPAVSDDDNFIDNCDESSNATESQDESSRSSPTSQHGRPVRMTARQIAMRKLIPVVPIISAAEKSQYRTIHEPDALCPTKPVTPYKY